MLRDAKTSQPMYGTHRRFEFSSPSVAKRSARHTPFAPIPDLFAS
jgi:hypothetical protein